MALRLEDLLRDPAWQALTRTFDNQAQARRLLLRFGYPTSDIHVMGNPQDFWTEICTQIENGITQRTLSDLLQDAAVLYPGSRPFQRWAAPVEVKRGPVEKTNRAGQAERLDPKNGSFHESGVQNGGTLHVPAAFPLRIFLCHARADKQPVRELYRFLRAQGHEPWLDEENLVAGVEWDVEIRRAVKQAHVILVCLSQHSVGKAGYVQKEIRFALDVADEQPAETIFIVPLMLEECEVPSRLSRWHWLKLFADDGHEKLLKSLRKRSEQIPTSQ